MSNTSEIDWNSYIGQRLGNFSLIHLLGKGAMGAVFVGYQHTLKRQVAVKLLPKGDASGYRQNLFREEGEVVAILTHPNIVPVYEMGEADGLFYQAMQLVKGRDLRSFLRDRKLNPIPSKRLIPLDQSLAILDQMLDALEYAHEEGVVHQDIKPANILIEERSGRALIVDFGIARAAQAEYGAEGRIVGTPQYMPPEQAQCLETDGRADIYSAGIILFELVCGAHPFKGEASDDVLIRKRQSPETLDETVVSKMNPQVPAPIRAAIIRATAADIARRYPECGTFRNELRNAARNLGITPGI